jgi:coenzyme F420-reducing hydrogenase beta subunit
MIINEEANDAFTTILEAAGAKPCASCGKCAAVCTDVTTAGEFDRGGEARPHRVDNGKWFCFECGHEE